MVGVRTFALAAAASFLGLVTDSVRANETTTYVYDALGRLIENNQTSGPNNGLRTVTCFDPAGNRSRYFVGTSGAPGCPNPPKPIKAVVVVPLNGFTVIPILDQ